MTMFAPGNRSDPRATAARNRAGQPLAKIRESNERRLSALGREGVRVVLSGTEVLEFVLEQVRDNFSERDLERQWVLHLASLLDQLDADLKLQRDLELRARY